MYAAKFRLFIESQLYFHQLVLIISEDQKIFLITRQLRLSEHIFTDRHKEEWKIMSTDELKDNVPELMRLPLRRSSEQ